MREIEGKIKIKKRMVASCNPFMVSISPSSSVDQSIAYI
jgi:hypothetical protein